MIQRKLKRMPVKKKNEENKNKGQGIKRLMKTEKEQTEKVIS